MNNNDIKELLDANFKAMRARIDANASITDLLYKSIEKQNGRIRTLEKETSIFRMMSRKPGVTVSIAVLLTLGIIFAIKNNLFQYIKFW